MASRSDSADARRLLEVAVRYADHGWPVLPLHAPVGRGCSCSLADCGALGKHPRTRRGLHEATTDVDQVRAWWNRWPSANIGVTTGAASGLLVVDVDLPHGPASLARLEAEHGKLPPTCEQRTGSGGRQLLFALPEAEVGNRAAVLPGIDVRGDGGYVVVPPSQHASGDRYEWVERVAPAEPPDWLVSLLDRTRHQAPQPDGRPLLPWQPRSRHEHYAAAALRRELARLAAAIEGTRNATLNRAAFSLGQLVAAGLLDHNHVATELERVAEHIGLGATEIRRTVASGLSAGLNQPRGIPDPVVAQAEQAADMGSLVRGIVARRR